MHEITAVFIPICTVCGGELETGFVQSDMGRTQNSTFDRDNPSERREQRVFVSACKECFVFKRANTVAGN